MAEMLSGLIERFLRTKGNEKQKPSDHPPGLYSQSGSLLLESPSPDLIEKLTKDSRITYFHFHKTNLVPENTPEQGRIEYTPSSAIEDVYPFSDHDLKYYDTVNSVGAPNNIAYKCCIDPLTTYLHQKYDGQNIAVRGVACSVSQKPISVEGKTITTPSQILKLGAEREVDHSPQIGFTPDDEIAYRSLQWLYQHPQTLRKRAISGGHPDDARAIFPLLIIYDRDQFDDPSTTTLPKDSRKRSRVIKEVIVLDYPLSRGEFEQQIEAGLV